MTGYGSRFKIASYERLKPFIEVHGKPMIEWVTKMFPGDEDKITFICRQEHLDSLDYMELEIKRVAPKATIFSINDWSKQGPIYDVMLASNSIAKDKPTIISYCDYYMHWNYENFKKEALSRDCDGAVPCYSGFHPHLIPTKNLYASCKVDDHDNLIEIKEKFSWEAVKAKGRHSPGMYYFKSGNIMKKYCKQMMNANDHVNGEYYASLPYNYMVRDCLKVWCPFNISYFCQWGTPEDMEEYLFWMNTIKGFKR